ncbi:hypothetical protein LPB140_10880 [Sphingorhabdus lutea]|uniref:DUF1489 family protein n=1 Tax=Sphingorhabdus lutea TaxID=1913578 RepID=A0A1L3JDK7_9SPHN|nr:DUF1489 domain-containing protein [Sphingorhabdus lutea]APG63206.1 hypothetical protein LPB140_10880 [Sphingorhabdus lutea]
MPVHLTKIAFRSESPATLKTWLESHAANNGGAGEALLTTRYMPKRADEMHGASLYWIHSGLIVGRSPIIGFQENGAGRYWIRLKPRLILVEPQAKRAHQGWRYLEDDAAPNDLANDDGEIIDNEPMPPKLMQQLLKMGLI